MKTIMKSVLASAIVAASLSCAADAATLVVDVTGAQSHYDFGTAGNQVETYFIGAGSTITDVSYDVSITAFSPSYLSEATLAFTSSDVDAGDGVFLAPGFADAHSGTGNYADSANLVDLGLDFSVGDDGLLRLEYFEDYDDASINPDAVWNSGTVTFTYTPADTGAVPEPATWAMMISGFGLVGGTLRASRRAVVLAA